MEKSICTWRKWWVVVIGSTGVMLLLASLLVGIDCLHNPTPFCNPHQYCEGKMPLQPCQLSAIVALWFQGGPGFYLAGITFVLGALAGLTTTYRKELFAFSVAILIFVLIVNGVATLIDLRAIAGFNR